MDTFANFSLSFVAGLASAVSISLIYWIARVVWKSQMKPAWENFLFSDARIDGQWETCIKSNISPDYREEARLQQVGHAITGCIICSSGPDKGRAYECIGTVRNAILSGYYWAKEATALDMGSFTLRLEENGNKLTGFTSFYFDDDHTIKSNAYIWTRKKGNI